MRTRVAVAIMLVLVASGATLVVFLLTYSATPYSPSSFHSSEELTMTAYDFPVGGPLTVILYNAGAVSENLAGAQYFVCVTQESCVLETPGGTCNTTFPVGPGVSCEAIITVSVTSLIFGASYTFKVVTPAGGVFQYLVIYGGSASFSTTSYSIRTV